MADDFVGGVDPAHDVLPPPRTQLPIYSSTTVASRLGVHSSASSFSSLALNPEIYTVRSRVADHSGYMSKRGKLFCKLKPFFFTLIGVKLLWFKDQSRHTLLGGGNVVDCAKLLGCKNQHNGLEVTCETGRVHHLMCESKVERERWYAAFESAIMLSQSDAFLDCYFAADPRDGEAVDDECVRSTASMPMFLDSLRREDGKRTMTARQNSSPARKKRGAPTPKKQPASITSSCLSSPRSSTKQGRSSAVVFFSRKGYNRKMSKGDPTLMIPQVGASDQLWQYALPRVPADPEALVYLWSAGII